MTSNRRRYGLVAPLVLLAVMGVVYLNRQQLSDWYRLRQYQPSSEVVALADQTTMTDKARRVFYTTHPDITGKDEFNAHCRQGSTSEYSIVLGCYVSSGGLYGNMYLYAINDERLNGVMQVTAAHEMLHAEYDRLSDKERARIDRLLRETYKNLPVGRIKQTIAQYEVNDPTSVPSELHSILGTELASLPSDLETYYQQYFRDRQAIVRLSEQYEGEFTRRENQVAEYDRQLAALKSTIEANQREIDAQNSSLTRQRATLDSLETSGDFAGFNARVSSYNQQVAAYNSLVQQTRGQIDEYNQLVDTRNNLALEVQQLTKAIDSRPETL